MTHQELAKIRKEILDAIYEPIGQGDQYGMWMAASPDANNIAYNVRRYLDTLEEQEEPIIVI